MAVSANRLELLQIADAVAREKSIDRDIVIGAMADAIDDFLQGMARAIGMDVSIFSIILLIIGLLFLFSGVRSLLRGSIIGGVIWLFLGLVVMGWLIR